MKNVDQGFLALYRHGVAGAGVRKYIKRRLARKARREPLDDADLWLAQAHDNAQVEVETPLELNVMFRSLRPWLDETFEALNTHIDEEVERELPLELQASLPEWMHDQLEDRSAFVHLSLFEQRAPKRGTLFED